MYILDSKTPKLIYKHFPDVKIIACLRNPIERLYSEYKYHVNMGYRYSIYKSFEKAIVKEYDFVKTGFYNRQLKLYYEIFPKENILILIYENLQKEPKEFLKKLYKFLGVKDTNFIPSVLNKKLNITGRKIVKNKIPFIKPIIFKFWDYPKIFSRLKTFFRQSRLDHFVNRLISQNKYQIRVDLNQKNKPTQNLTKKARRYLKKLYQKDIEKLQNLIEQDLSHWE